jgi:hypothetical protein
MKRLKLNCTPIITTIFLLLFGHGVWGQVIISQVYEGASNDKWIEITNVGQSTVDLASPTQFKIGIWTISGSTGNCLITGSPTSSIVLTGNIIPGGKLLIKNTSASNTVPHNPMPVADLSNITVAAFNGNDGLAIFTGTSTIVDAFGNGINNADKSYHRNSNVLNVNASFTISEWTLKTLTEVASSTNINSEFIGTHIFSSTPTWTGATSTDWNTASNWNPATVPTSNDNVIIPSSGITNFPVATSLTIASGSTMTLNSNARLTVNGTLTNNGTLTLESGATLVQGTGNTVAGSGTFNVKQVLTGAGGATPSGRFWYMGSPLSGATSTAFDAAGDNRLWTYAEATQSYTEITANGVAMSPIQGHVARLGASSTINFTGGVLNSGDFTNSTLTNTGTGSTRGYTLISNPYPSFLDWNLISAGATGIATSLWYRTNDGSSMVYDTYNATGGISTLNSGVSTNPRYIPPMQAFWVYNPTDGTTGSLTISNNMRSHQTNGGLKDATDFPAFVRLNLENDGAIDQTVLYFDNNAAAGYDNFDSDKMMVPNTAQVYTLVGNKKLAINGMKSIKANKQVPLTVEFPTAKAYSFNATEVAMFDGIVLLEDRLKKVFQDLTMNPVYEFVADAGATSDRFVVHFQANSGVAGIESVADNGIAIVSNATGLVTISLSEELPAMGTIQIIDINGKVIATQAINEQTTTMNINAATGVYHVLVHSATKVARKKIVITK